MLRSVLLGFGSVTLLAVCASAGSTVRLGAGDSGRTVTLRVADALVVALAGNPTTGYSWQVESSGAPALQPEGAPTFKPDRKLRGAGGVTTSRYRAVAEGTSTLRLEYRRPWEKGVAPAATFEVTVVVTK